MQTFAMVVPTSETDFEVGMMELIKEQILTQEVQDFSYLGGEINDILTKLMNYRVGQCTLASTFLDMKFFLELKQDPMYLKATIEEARTLFMQGMAVYFQNPESVKARRAELDKLERLKKFSKHAQQKG